MVPEEAGTPKFRLSAARHMDQLGLGAKDSSFQVNSGCVGFVKLRVERGSRYSRDSCYLTQHGNPCRLGISQEDDNR